MHRDVFFWTWGLVGLHGIPCLIGVESIWEGLTTLMGLVPLHALAWYHHGTWDLVARYAPKCILLDLGFNALVWINVGLGARTCHALVRYHYVTWDLTWWYGYGQAPTFYS